MDDVNTRLYCAARIILISTLLLSAQVFAATIPDPCAGDFPLLNIVDRPSHSDSACAVPFKQVLLETGYQYSNQIGGSNAQNYPQAELRIGLPARNEFALFLPNYNLQTVNPRSGYNATAIRLKHEIGYNEHWLATVEGILGLPTGGGGFGSNKYDPTINGIVNYAFNPAWTLVFMLGVSSSSVPASQGGQHYTTVNPDILLSWQSGKWELYAEWYAQTRTGPNQGAGSNADAGVLYLVTQSIEVDASFGHRISGKFENLNQYYGAGISVLF
jgi:hypothetical protein